MGRQAISARNVMRKRAYEPPSASDGDRLLIDRLWPRGVSKAEAKLDDWLKDLAPSAALRRWFDHDPGRWAEFQRRYRLELADQADALEALRRRARQGRFTLVYAARDEVHNDAVVLRQVILGIPTPAGASSRDR